MSQKAPNRGKFPLHWNPVFQELNTRKDKPDLKKIFPKRGYPSTKVRSNKRWTSLRATFVAMKENPQITTAHSAGQDISSPSLLAPSIFIMNRIFIGNLF